MATMQHQQEAQVRGNEDSNWEACRTAFAAHYPKEYVARADECDAGSWSCRTCPWKDKGNAYLHSENHNG